MKPIELYWLFRKIGVQTSDERTVAVDIELAELACNGIHDLRKDSNL